MGLLVSLRLFVKRNVSRDGKNQAGKAPWTVRSRFRWEDVLYLKPKALVLAGAYVLLYMAAWCVLIFVKKAKGGSQVW